jgi:hypothetical protein
MLTYENAGPGLGDVRLSPIADNLMLLGIELGERTRRTVRIVKARGIEHSLELRELAITAAGLVVR